LFEAQAAEHAGEGAAHGAEGGLPNPMHQFEIKRLIPFEWFGFDASFTNSALFMIIAAGVITLFTLYAMRNRSLVPSRLRSTRPWAPRCRRRRARRARPTRP